MEQLLTRLHVARFLPSRPWLVSLLEHIQPVVFPCTHATQSLASRPAYRLHFQQEDRAAKSARDALDPLARRDVLLVCRRLEQATSRDRTAWFCRESASLEWMV